MAFDILKHIKLYLLGGLPNTIGYEQKQHRLEELCRRYEMLQESVAVQSHRELATQITESRRQSKFPKKELSAMKQEFKELQKNADVVQFLKIQKKAHSFEKLLQWEEFFYDNFDDTNLDPLKWMTQRSAPSDVLPEIHYSPAEERHLFTDDGQNLQLTGHSLQLLVKNESADGLVFSRDFGFVPARRNFTAGMVNTGNTCRLVYGKIEAKVKFHLSSNSVYHAIWLSNGQRLPHVNLLRIGRKLEFSAFARKGNDTEKSVSLWSKTLLKQDTYYIVQALWTQDTIEWHINGKKMFSAPNTIHEPLFLVFSSGVVNGKSNSPEVSTFEIEWVKMSSLKN